MPRRLDHLVVKPTLACTAACPTCASRRRLHRDLRGGPTLSFMDWENVLSDAVALGVWHLTISGGEPTIYPRLTELIRAGKRHGLRVRMNSNGSFDGDAIAADLLGAGLDVLDISLYSHVASRHDAMRGSKGLWEKATRNIELFARLQQGGNRGFTLITQTILTRENYRDFGDLLELNLRAGSSGWLVSYLEGDFDGLHGLSPRQVLEFREDILPRALDRCRGLEWDIRSLAIASLRRVFSPRDLSYEQWAAGWYRADNRPCRIPRRQALILASGDVHPCNVVEYTHANVVGNVRSQPLGDIWRGTKWNDFRNGPCEDCRRCPMGRHVFVPLRCRNTWTAILKTGLRTFRMDSLEERWLAYRIRRQR
ncbi:MAG: radical SAM protein [Thermodesulfobacteriota bacterium]